MTYKQAHELVSTFVELSIEDQKAQGNVYANAYVIGQLTALLSITLSEDNTYALRRMINETKLNTQTKNDTQRFCIKIGC